MLYIDMNETITLNDIQVNVNTKGVISFDVSNYEGDQFVLSPEILRQIEEQRMEKLN